MSENTVDTATLGVGNNYLKSFYKSFQRVKTLALLSVATRVTASGEKETYTEHCGRFTTVVIMIQN